MKGLAKELLGIHHVTAMTDSAERNYKFMTEILGMRLVKKTVNQDDIHTYHTFFADDQGLAGTDMTFFDFPNIPQGRYGTNAITRTALRVPSDKAIEFYKQRFEDMNVKHEEIQELFGKKILPFEETDGQRYQLISDENNKGVRAGIPWQKGPVPQEYAVYGLGPVEITVSYYNEFKQLMMEVYGFHLVEEEKEVALLEVGEGGNGGQMILRHKSSGPEGQQGYGEVHHVAFRVKDEAALEEWLQHYNKLGIGSSGLVDRFYFGALYARIGHILIELSTDGPGFDIDEPYETMGESLSLPSFLEPQRQHIEATVRPFDTRLPKNKQ